MTKNWEDNKERICHLYKDRGYTLQDVRKIMEENHEFKASTRSYRDKLSQWNAYKFSTRRATYPPTGTTRTLESAYDIDSPPFKRAKLDFEPPNDHYFSLSASPPSSFAAPMYADEIHIYDRRLDRNDAACACPYCPQHATRPTRMESNGSEASIDEHTAAQALLDLKPSHLPNRRDSFGSFGSDRTMSCDPLR